MKIRLLLLRHGTPVIKKALLGQTDCDITNAGLEQMHLAVQPLINQIDAVVTSPLIRCLRFARQLADKNSKPLQIIDDLQECNFGDWDGWTYEKLNQEKTKSAEQFFSDPFNNPPPNAENLSMFYFRTVQAIKDLCKTAIEQQQDEFVFLVVTHAGVIRNLVAWALKMDFKLGHQFKHFDVEYSSITELVIFPLDDDLFVKLNRLNHTYSTMAGSV